MAKAAKVWTDLDALGVPGIKGVWSPPEAAGWGTTVSRSSSAMRAALHKWQRWRRNAWAALPPLKPRVFGELDAWQAMLAAGS